ncbi:CDP-alcohol phosphatidyltransferase family protein [Microbulbifer sp. M83]|uniref:CDP-alcohol phosphatidyltransferase family protein n=1 Tax=Microbulbifer sp. M83 TaxID=3118246 RepID=UPI002FE37810
MDLPTARASTGMPGYQAILPWALVALRGLLAPLSIVITWLQFPPSIWLGQFAMAIISDIYDGRLARRWCTASPALRRADSMVDTFYALACLCCFCIAAPQVMLAHLPGILSLLALDAVRAIIDWRRFGKRASYHAWSMKLFGLSIIPAGILVMTSGQPHWTLWLSIVIGLYAQLEALSMSLILPRWTHDVKHTGAALAIRRAGDTNSGGKP